MIPNHPQIHSSVYLAPGSVVVGDVSIDELSSVWHNAVIRADHSTIRIGKNSNVQDNSVLHVDPWTNVKIGDYVTIGHSAIIHGCEIGDCTVVGMGAIIMNNAVIGKNCMIGAGSVVTQNKVIPDGSLVIGAPAKIMRQLTEEEQNHNLQNAEHYVEISREYKEQNL